MRDALLKCATLSESEVDAYIAYQESIVYEDVPLDYELTHPDENITLSCLYSDGILHTTIRLTIRLTEELDKLLRTEAVRRGTNLNQMMLYILNRGTQESNLISPRSFS